jgi:hypothetical protein
VASEPGMVCGHRRVYEQHWRASAPRGLALTQEVFGRVTCLSFQVLVNEAGNDTNFETRNEDVAWIRKLSP